MGAEALEITPRAAKELVSKRGLREASAGLKHDRWDSYLKGVGLRDVLSFYLVLFDAFDDFSYRNAGKTPF